MMILGGGEYSTTCRTTEQNPAGAVHQTAGAGGVASGDGGVTDRLPRGSPHPWGQTDRAVRAPSGTPAKGQFNVWTHCVRWYLSLYSDIWSLYCDICLCVLWYPSVHLFMTLCTVINVTAYSDILLSVQWYLTLYKLISCLLMDLHECLIEKEIGLHRVSTSILVESQSK